MENEQPWGVNEDAAPPPPPPPPPLPLPLPVDEVPVGESLPLQDVAPRPAPTTTAPSTAKSEVFRHARDGARRSVRAVIFMVFDASIRVEPGVSANANAIAVAPEPRMDDTRRGRDYATGRRYSGRREDGGGRCGSIKQ